MTFARISAALTGLAALVLGAVTLAGPTVADEHWGTRGAVVNAAGLVAFAAMIGALEHLTPFLTPNRVGRIGRRIAQVGLGLMVIESAASQAHGGNTLGPVFMLGLLLTAAGLLAVAGDGLRRRRWLGPLPFLAFLIAIGAGDHGGFLLLGLTWAGLAITTNGQQPLPRSEPAPQR